MKQPAFDSLLPRSSCTPGRYAFQEAPAGLPLASADMASHCGAIEEPEKEEAAFPDAIKLPAFDRLLPRGSGAPGRYSFQGAPAGLPRADADVACHRGAFEEPEKEKASFPDAIKQPAFDRLLPRGSGAPGRYSFQGAPAGLPRADADVVSRRAAFEEWEKEEAAAQDRMQQLAGDHMFPRSSGGPPVADRDVPSHRHRFWHGSDGGQDEEAKWKDRAQQLLLCDDTCSSGAPDRSTLQELLADLPEADEDVQSEHDCLLTQRSVHEGHAEEPVGQEEVQDRVQQLLLFDDPRSSGTPERGALQELLAALPSANENEDILSGSDGLLASLIVQEGHGEEPEEQEEVQESKDAPTLPWLKRIQGLASRFQTRNTSRASAATQTDTAGGQPETESLGEEVARPDGGWVQRFWPSRRLPNVPLAPGRPRTAWE